MTEPRKCLQNMVMNLYKKPRFDLNRGIFYGVVVVESIDKVIVSIRSRFFIFAGTL